MDIAGKKSPLRETQDEVGNYICRTGELFSQELVPEKSECVKAIQVSRIHKRAFVLKLMVLIGIYSAGEKRETHPQNRLIVYASLTEPKLGG